MRTWPLSLRCLAAVPLIVGGLAACRPATVSDGGGATGGVVSAAGGGTSSGGVLLGGAPSSGGVSAAGSGASGGGGGELALPEPTPKYHPPPGFEDCLHAEVKVDCKDGWCKLPPSCFVMGSPVGEWHRGRDSENQAAVTLTHWMEIQQKELTRKEWTALTGLEPRGPEKCTDEACPVSMVSWWDAVHAANLLSAQQGLSPCYEPVSCTGSLGWDLNCAGVAEPEKSVYDCEGYRLPTRAEAEYAARAGTISTFYSGDITVYEDSASCLIDPALEKIAWYCFNSGDRAHVGGELQANGFGLYDLVGNLLEWAGEPMLYVASPGGVDPRGEVGSFRDRVFYGGQYDGQSYLARPAGLLGGPWNGRGEQGGFRLVRSLPE